MAIDFKGKFCSSPWDTVNIDSGGDVYSCTCSNWTDLKLGNVLNKSLTEIYKSSSNLNSLRNSILYESYSQCIESACSKIRKLPLKINCQYDSNAILPTNLVLAIDNNCNLKCPSCRVAKVFSETPNPTTEFILNRLGHDYKKFDKRTIVMLDGAGDVFVSKAYNDFLFGHHFPECWYPMILTNGNLLLKKKKEIAGIAKKIILITVSLDAATPETYAITRGGSFENAINGVKMLRDMDVGVYLQFVLQQANHKELLAYKELANSLGVRYGIQKINQWEHMTPEYWQVTKMEDNPAVDYALLKEHLTILRKDRDCVLDGGVQWLFNTI